MHTGKLVFAQLMGHLSLHTFRQCVAKYLSRYPTVKFSHLDQFLCMAFAQSTYRESLRNIETCLRAHKTKLYHLGIRGNKSQTGLYAIPKADQISGYTKQQRTSTNNQQIRLCHAAEDSIYAFVLGKVISSTTIMIIL